MQELAQEDKKTTSKNKSNTSESDSQIMNSSKTSEVASTSKEKDLTPYWNLSCKAKSQKLLSLTKTGCVGSDLSSSSPLQAKTIAQSWFSTTVNSHLKPSLCKTFFPSSTFSRVGFTDSENTIVRSKKIRIYPKNQQLIRRYLGLSRYWFNAAVAYLKNEGTKASLGEVRKIQKEEHPEWAFDCPQRIREHAINDACNAVKNAKKKFMQTGQFQEVHFRTKKDRVQRFGFDAKSLKDGFVFRETERKICFYVTENHESSEIEGTRIVREDGRYFVIIPQSRYIKMPENQRFDCVAIDPGVRTFATFYSEQAHGKIGEGDFKKVFRLCLGLDKLYSKMTKAKSQKKRNMRKAAGRLRWKIYDLIEELHKKTASFLVTRFDKIFLPAFETAQMVTKLRSKTARSMLSFAHFRFKSFLKAKAEEYSCEVVDCNEAYTSKTCSYCGEIHNIGSKKMMRCECGANVDRDGNGARGIFLRALLVTTPQAIAGNR